MKLYINQKTSVKINETINEKCDSMPSFHLSSSLHLSCINAVAKLVFLLIFLFINRPFTEQEIYTYAEKITSTRS